MKNDENRPVLHLMINNRCTNDCPLCCNKQYNVEDIPVVTPNDLKNIDTICITGGAPLLHICNYEHLIYAIIKQYNNIKHCFTYMNGGECSDYTEMLWINFFKTFPVRLPMYKTIDFGLTISPKSKNDWDKLKKYVAGNLTNWTSNRIYCFSDKDIIKAEKLFINDKIDIIKREWQKEFKPAPNTIFRRLPIFTI